MSAAWVDDFLLAHRGELVALRHHLHAHPEASHQEVETTELISERLRIAGLSPRTLESGTGLWCDIGDRAGSDVPVLALRADIDALRMDDTKDVPYRSTVPGVTHGCGHDLHTTVVLGAGLALAARTGLGEGDGAPLVRLIFEPAEESVPGGAVSVIEEGVLDGVGAIIGFHADPRLDVGLVGVRSGPLTAAADIVEIDLHGPGGHTARPELTVDLVSLAARIVGELPEKVRGGNDGVAPLELVFGALLAGDAANVIPTTAVLRGTVRTTDHSVWGGAEATVRAALAQLTAGTPAHVTCTYRRGVPPVVNDDRVARIVARTASEVLGDAAVREAPRSLGGDSFAWYQQIVPGCYVRLGVHDPARAGERLDLHSGAFDVDDRAIEVGIRLMVALAGDHGVRSLAD